MTLGFICEGKTEKKIVESPGFRQFLKNISHTCVTDVIDAEGNNNLLPKHLPQFTKILLNKGAEKVVVLTDLDEDACITNTKQRINAPADHLVIISVKQIEAWFLADDDCLSAICKKKIHFPKPEDERVPFETIKGLLLKHTGRGVGDKVLLASKMLNNNFSILKAASHPECKSAKYFVEKLKSLNNKN